MKKREDSWNKRMGRKGKRRLLDMLLKSVGPVQEKPQFTGKLSTLCILAQEKLGDAILLTPLIKALKDAHPELDIHIVAYSDIASFFEQDPHVTRVHKGKNDYWNLYQSARKHRFDLLFNTKDHASFTFLYQSRLIPARFRVGIAHPAHTGFYDYLIPTVFHQHIIDKYLSLLDFLKLPYDADQCRPYIPETPIRPPVKDFVRRLQSQNVVGLNLSAGEPDREWSLNKWRDLLGRIADPCILLATGSRIADKISLEKECAHVIQSPVTQSFYEAAYIIQGLRYLISPDTSLIHVASGYKIPVIGLYRADKDHYSRFAPYRVPHRQCISPTFRIEDIEVDTVIRQFESLREAFR